MEHFNLLKYNNENNSSQLIIHKKDKAGNKFLSKLKQKNNNIDYLL